MPKVLYVVPRQASFIQIDRRLLEERYDVEEWYQPGHRANPLKVWRAVRRCDVVVGWWAHTHTFLPITFAWLQRRPSLLIVGGFDVANLPEIDYGHQRGGFRKWMSRWIIARATKVVTNSYYSQGEVERNVGLAREHVDVMHHGVPDDFGPLPAADKEPLAITVGIVDTANLERKGLRPFVRAAARLPEVEFVVIGKWNDGAIDVLKAEATPNVRFTGFVSDEELESLYHRAGAYVQASQHEGFGVSVAEAMLAGCVPVVSKEGALTEVVGDLGIVLDEIDPNAIAAAVTEAIAAPREQRERTRQRVLDEFSLEMRGNALASFIDPLLGRTRETSYA
jgi:glycosyltransferase involved in cell wall biosynthesis